MTRRLHHVGVVVPSIEAIGNLFGPTSLRFSDPVQKVRVRFVGSPERGLIELIEPTADDSPISAFLAKGGGLHHTAFEVDDFDKACVEMRSRAVPLGRPWVGFEGRRLAFFMPKGAPLPEEIVGPIISTPLG